MGRPLVLLIMLLAAVPATASARTTLAVEQGRVHADAHGKRIAWSSFDPQGRIWRLVTLEKGKVVQTRAPASTHPFRLDVGPGPDGKPVAVYPRCEAVAECDLYLYDFERRRQRHLKKLSTDDASESLPTIWKKWIAFSRRSGGVSTMYRARLNGRELQVLPSGQQVGPSGPIAMEMRRRRVAFVWSRPGAVGVTQHQLWVTKDNDLDLLDVTNSDEQSESTFVTPEIRRGRIYYGRPVTGGPGNELRRINLRNERRHYVRAPFRHIVTAVWRGKRFLLSRARVPEGDDPEAECRRPGSDPADTICRLYLGRKVTDWTRRPGTGP